MFLNKIRWKADKQEHLIGFYVFYSSDKWQNKWTEQPANRRKYTCVSVFVVKSIDVFMNDVQAKLHFYHNNKWSCKHGPKLHGEELFEIKTISRMIYYTV